MSHSLLANETEGKVTFLFTYQWSLGVVLEIFINLMTFCNTPYFNFGFISYSLDFGLSHVLVSRITQNQV